MDSTKGQQRVLARHFARELSIEEMGMANGGCGGVVGPGAGKTQCDPNDPTGSTCGAADSGPCDLDWHNND